jgi:hypothetical protein
VSEAAVKDVAALANCGPTNNANKAIIVKTPKNFEETLFIFIFLKSSFY